MMLGEHAMEGVCLIDSWDATWQVRMGVLMILGCHGAVVGPLRVVELLARTTAAVSESKTRHVLRRD